MLLVVVVVEVVLVMMVVVVVVVKVVVVVAQHNSNKKNVSRDGSNLEICVTDEKEQLHSMLILVTLNLTSGLWK